VSGPTTHNELAGFPGELHCDVVQIVGHAVASEGFEPPKAEPADLQSDPFGRLGNSPCAPDQCIHQSGARIPG
jgi:hypothetical protein